MGLHKADLALPALLSFLAELAAAWQNAAGRCNASRQPGNSVLATVWQQIALTALQMLQVAIPGSGNVHALGSALLGVPDCKFSEKKYLESSSHIDEIEGCAALIASDSFSSSGSGSAGGSHQHRLQRAGALLAEATA